jgi:hypothetical protein
MTTQRSPKAGDPAYNGDLGPVVKADGTVVDWLGFTGPGTTIPTLGTSTSASPETASWSR